MNTIVIIYLVLINIVAFATYGYDKYKAIHHKRRISEATLLMLVVIGGGIGAWTGMGAWHHKTRHEKFYIGVPAILLTQIAILAWIYVDTY